VTRFADRDHHQIFLEPEGLHCDTVYPNGISTSLPQAVQQAMVATIPGLERAKIVRPGYAIEYDFVDPRSLDPSLQVRGIAGLFLAGQINGTTGYEEAGAQGLMAGLNAARYSSGQDAVILPRTDAYIGVMIDDLVTQGVSEPYRMFTSRSEYRLTLRADNADLRLTKLGVGWGVVGPARSSTFRLFETELSSARARAHTEGASAASMLPAVRDGKWRSASAWLGHSGVSTEALEANFPWLKELDSRVRNQLETESMYAGYLVRQEADIRSVQREERLTIASDINYMDIGGLSAELQSKLWAARPSSLAAASRIQGMTPAAMSTLCLYLRRNRVDQQT
jgi:tRNA uridine 5-carboxymethylaminomethyl modification enzyme